jgi:rubrerythrin
MELSTFGAILKYVIAWEKKRRDYYQNIAELVPLFKDFAAKAGKREKILQRGRREWVTEMILEPISGVSKSDYELSWSYQASNDPIEQAIKIEDISQRLYTDLANCISIPEVARIFRRFAKDHGQNSGLLKSKKNG